MEDTPASRKPSSRWLLALTLILAAVLFYFAVRNVNWGELLATFQRGNLSLLLVSVGVLSLSCVARALRWRVLLSAETEKIGDPVIPRQHSLWTVFWALMTGYLGNSYLPARAGELIRSMLVGEEIKVSKSFALATALTERIMDAVILVGVGALAMSTVSTLPPEMLQGLRALGLVGGIGAIIVLVAPRISGLVRGIIFALPVISDGLREKLWDFTEKFLVGANALQHWGRMGQFLVYSVLIWSLDTLNGLVIAQAMGVAINPAQMFILLAALGLFSAVPSTPGYVGVYQFVAVNVLGPFGIDETHAVAYIFAMQAVQYVGITLWGLIGLWQLRHAARRLGLFFKKQPAPVE